MKVAVPIAKNILAALLITAAIFQHGGIQKKKIHGSGSKTLIISDKEINYILKIVPALEDSNILLNGITKTIENETKQQKRGFLGILFGVLGASLLEIC